MRTPDDFTPNEHDLSGYEHEAMTLKPSPEGLLLLDVDKFKQLMDAHATKAVNQAEDEWEKAADVNRTYDERRRRMSALELAVEAAGNPNAPEGTQVTTAGIVGTARRFYAYISEGTDLA